MLKTWLDIATTAGLAAGKIIKDYFGRVQTIEEKGRIGDLVTSADRASEAEILKHFQQYLPDHGILAEESGLQGIADSDYLWSIDPLDGTTNYAHGYPYSVVSIGLLVKGKPTLGVIYNPFREELYQAILGEPATCNGQKIAVSETKHLKDSLLVTGFAYDRHTTPDNNYAEFCHLTHLTQGVRRSGSAALDLTDVACGRLDGYWERGLSPWDLCAGVVLVESAGGKVTAYDQSEFTIASGRILATNGQLHSALSEALLTTPKMSFWEGSNSGGF